jgi:hypothetical protein
MFVLTSRTAGYATHTSGGVGGELSNGRPYPDGQLPFNLFLLVLCLVRRFRRPIPEEPVACSDRSRPPNSKQSSRVSERRLVCSTHLLAQFSPIDHESRAYHPAKTNHGGRGTPTRNSRCSNSWKWQNLLPYSFFTFIFIGIAPKCFHW